MLGGRSPNTNYNEFIDTIERNKYEWADTKIIGSKFPYKKAVKIQPVETNVNSNVKKTVKVFNQDILDCAVNLKLKGYNPLVLVMTKPTSAGSGLDAGVMREEEEIFRRTNCNLCIGDLYPLENNDYLLFSASVIKDSQYNRLNEPVLLDFISSAAVRQPATMQIKENKGVVTIYKNTNDANIMREKIFGMFKIAVERGYDCLLLSAYGCGSCANPIEIVVQYFNEAIKTFPVKYVIFAINNLRDPLIPIKNTNFTYFNNNILRL